MEFNKSFTSLLNEEKQYCQALSTLIEVTFFIFLPKKGACLFIIIHFNTKKYLIPLRHRFFSGKEILKLEDITYIFSNIETIQEIHQSITAQLSAIQENNWPFLSGIGLVTQFSHILV